MANARWCASKLSNPDSGSLRIIAWVPKVGVRVSWVSSVDQEKMVFQLWQGLVSPCSWLQPGLCTCTNLMDPTHIVSSGWV